VRDLRWPEGNARRPALRQRRRDDRQGSIGNGRIDPVGKDLSDVTGIVGIAIVVVGQRFELGIQGGTSDAHPEHEDEDNGKHPSNHPTHAHANTGKALGMRVPRLRARTRNSVRLSVRTFPYKKPLDTSNFL
jgi:hypothetical protein